MDTLALERAKQRIADAAAGRPEPAAIEAALERARNQAIRRLERLEGDLLAERHARVDDLALLVDLVSSGWRGVDARLARLEGAPREETDDARVEPLPAADVPDLEHAAAA